MIRTRRRAVVRAGAALVALLPLVGCSAAGAGGPPRPGWTSGPPVSLDGVRVLVLPAQGVRGVRGDVDAELAFGLETRGERVAWILPGELRRALERSPGLRASPDALPVGMFLGADVRRIGDPLYGELRRMGTLTEARAAFLPVAVRARAAADSVPAGVEIVAALVDIRTGRVIWSGVVEGVGDARSPSTLAAAVDALALALLGSIDERRTERGSAANGGLEREQTQDPQGGGSRAGRSRDGGGGVRAGGPPHADRPRGRGLLHLLR